MELYTDISPHKVVALCNTSTGTGGNLSRYLTTKSCVLDMSKHRRGANFVSPRRPMCVEI